MPGRWHLWACHVSPFREWQAGAFTFSDINVAPTQAASAAARGKPEASLLLGLHNES